MSENVLFITLDSCRYDTFESQYEANMLPNLKSIGPLHKVQSPSHFTYGSHSAFWMGFTPGNAELDRHYLNPKVGKIFRMSHPGMNAGTKDLFVLDGVNIVDGFNNKGYLTIGTGAVEWFNPKTKTGSVLGDYFHQFFYSENTWSLESQLKWIDEVLSEKDDDSNVFCFLNIGETHVPYWHEGASWDRWPSPCVPFGSESCDASESAQRQRACLRWIDSKLGSLLSRFKNDTILVCADHGDCWGEDNLWEHGISHPATINVPLVLQVKGEKIEPSIKTTSTSRYRGALSRLKNWKKAISKTTTK